MVSSLGAKNPYMAINTNGYVGNQFALIQENNWHHCVVTIDEIFGGSLETSKMYLDGKNVKFDVSYVPGLINTKINLPLILGQFSTVNNDPRPFNGSIDDLGIWDRVINDSEIQYLYQNYFKP